VSPVGALLDRYRVERELGAGAMGVVHAAVDLMLERRVALTMRRRAAQTPRAYEWLLREARAMGQSLAEWLNAGTRSCKVILEAFVAAGRGLAAVHAAGMVHRDFKRAMCCAPTTVGLSSPISESHARSTPPVLWQSGEPPRTG
jgi:serine/threonine protein kinase